MACDSDNKKNRMYYNTPKRDSLVIILPVGLRINETFTSRKRRYN